MKKILLLLWVFCITLSSQLAVGQACQGSNAGSATYNSGWSNGQNDNATGFGNWQLNSGTGMGFFVASSTGNDDGGSPPNINTSGRAWGMFSNSGVTANAVRSFVNEMAVGHSLSFSIDNGSINNGATVGIGLQNSSSQNLMELYFRGGQANYEYNDASGTNVSTGLGFTRGGLDVKITRTATGSYSISITRKENAQTVSTTRNFFNPGGGQNPAQIRFFNANAGSGSVSNFYCNSLSICQPTITPATNTFSAFTSTYGTVSAAQTVAISGAELVANITATAGTGFEVSNNGTTYGASTTFTQSGGTASGTLYVRLSAAASAGGSYNNVTAVTLSSTGATSRTYTTAATGNVVNKATPTLSVTNSPQIFTGSPIAATVSGSVAGTVNDIKYNGSGTVPSAAGVYAVTADFTPSDAVNYNSLDDAAAGNFSIVLSQSAADYRSKTNGVLSAAGTWEYFNGTSWVDATQKPGEGNNVDVLHDVTFDEAFIIGAGKSFTVSAGTADFNGQPVTVKSTAAGTG
ncbi:MAG TPA: MBG domain-containing protein, partial [Ferruginibacter sp.]|nr:MBG domain-containing protein [Ferruginibacter sp.]HMP21557.1 MBG domain-containing protein [Ferruginibacter sp.]